MANKIPTMNTAITNIFVQGIMQNIIGGSDMANV